MEEMNNAKKEYRKVETRAFAFVLETIVVFGLPAILAVVIGKEIFETNTGVYILLAVAFVCSWILLLARLKRVMRDLDEARRKVHKSPDGQEGGSK